jgi:DNA helicase-2/ATP-dependent DNA helicase PcrA
MEKDKLLEKLNSDQRKAVTHKEGPLLIVAGAGTGKTTVITRRIAYIIDKKWAKPSEIVALTFTEKSALEMEERVDQLVPYGFIDTQVSTFHSFASGLIRDYTLELKLPANFKVLTKSEQAIFVRENIFNLELDYYRPISNPISHIDKLLNHFSRLKDELVEPNQYLKYAQKQYENAKDKESKKEAGKTLELARAYKRYNQLLFENGKLDYGDLLFLSYKLLKNDPKIRRECQQRFKYILVDEFQDTNYAQYELVKLLTGNKKNITVVGDDDQSIYRFRGASISNILTFKDDFPSSKLIVLKQNYRSTKQILNHSYALIQHNNPDRLEFRYKIDKKLSSDRNGCKPELIYAQSLSAETDEVAKKIKEIKKSKKLKFNDFAILARANDHLKPFIEALNNKGIPFVFVGSSRLFEQEEVRSLIAFLKALVNPEDNLSYFQLLTSEHFKVSPSTLIDYFAKSRLKNRNLEHTLKEMKPNTRIRQALSCIEKYRQLIALKSAGEVLYGFLKETNYFKKILDSSEAEAQKKIANIARLFERIHEFDKTSQNKSVIAFLDNLELILSFGDEVQSFDYDPDIDAVNVLTVHSAKGLEYEVVFLVNLVNERFPSRRREEEIRMPEKFIHEKLPKGDYHLQEERRLFYVGATRAKSDLFLTAGEDYGGKRRKKLSQFVLEFLDNPNLIKQKSKLSDMEKIERFCAPRKKQQKTTGKKPKLLKLSQAQIDDYYTCPKKYYYSNIIKIPLPVNWHFMYGTAIHSAVARYFRAKIKGQEVTLADLVEEFEALYDNEGFITREQEEIRHKKGLETLKRFFKQNEKNGLLPDKIEESFSFRIGNVIIRGRYDLLKETKSGVEIFDYKTSEVNDQKKADYRVSQSTQMTTYALSCFVKTGKIPKTTLVFIESNISATKQFSLKKLEKAKEQILETAKGIQEENYTAKPDKGNCQYCPFNNICPESKI